MVFGGLVDEEPVVVAALVFDEMVVDLVDEEPVVVSALVADELAVDLVDDWLVVDLIVDEPLVSVVDLVFATTGF